MSYGIIFLTVEFISALVALSLCKAAGKENEKGIKNEKC